MVEKKQKQFEDMTVKELTKLMAGPSQLNRKNAARELAIRVRENPEKFKDYIPDFIDALSRPEAQTRWEALVALTLLVPIDAKACKGAIEGAEEALFDEKTSLIRENAIRFLARYGATSMQRSKEVWPLIKDALQQYHGEIDYDKLLERVWFFATGKLDANVKKEFRAVVKDIYNSVGGTTKVRLNRILITLKGQKIPKASGKKSESKNIDKAKNNEKKKSETSKKTNVKNATDKKKKADKKIKPATKEKTTVKKKTDTKKKSDVKKKVDAKKKPTKKPVKKPAKKQANKPIKKQANKPIKKQSKKPVKKQVKKAVKKVVKKSTGNKKSKKK